MDLIAFLHELRTEIVELTQNPAILIRIQVEQETRTNTVMLEVVSIGKHILPFSLEPIDFEHLDASKQFILNEVRTTL